jgi:hypothetical protein
MHGDEGEINALNGLKSLKGTSLRKPGHRWEDNIEMNL